MKEQDAAHSFTGAPTWYTEEQMYHWLIREDYSEQIAKELSGKWAADLQGAFNKGYEKSVNELTRLRSELQHLKTHLKIEIDANEKVRSALQQAKEEIESLRDQINQ